MAILKHIATHVFKKSAHSNNITDLEMIQTDRGMLLVAISNKGAGLTSYMLTGTEQSAVAVSHENSPDFGLYYSAPKLELIERSGDTYQIIITGQNASARSGLLMSGDGNLRDFAALFPASQMPATVVAMESFEIAGHDYMLTGTDGSTSLTLYRMSANLALTRLGVATPNIKATVDGEYTDIEVVQIGNRTFAYAASAQGNMVGMFEVGAGGISSIGSLSGAATIGISAPREVEAVTTANGRFLIVTGGESDSLSVFRISASGGLSLTDHVVDSTLTRFEAATAIATVELGGRAYIFVGGADDGISIFTLDGQGRLILLEVLEDTASLTLANVSAIEARVIGGKIAVFVTSAIDTGITQLSYDPGQIGKSLVGGGRLSGTALDDILVGTGASSVLAGGAGDDILIARSGAVTLSGGVGRDTFIPGYGATRVTILDYDPKQDRLDLSELAFIRSAAQLQVLSTATGAILVAGTVRIEIRTANGASLRASDFSEDMFRLAHYANDIDFSGLVTPVNPNPGEPSVEKPPQPVSGGYVGPAALPPLLWVAKAIYGTNRADRLIAPVTGGQIYGNAGNDLMIGAGGRRSNLFGGAGNDTLRGGKLADLLDGGDGNDLIAGGGGIDRLFGGRGNDTLNGDAGDDRINGGTGRNTLFGGDGNDVIWASGAGGNVMRGGNGSDLIQGVNADSISGGAGHDRIFGRGNNNRINGDDGNDLIRVTGWGNVLAGGKGNDSIYGGIGPDTLYGNEGDDRMYGGGGSDRLFGHTGNDRMYGDAGNDRLYGMEGNDTMFGGTGRDLLMGGSGNDLIQGQSENDTIVGESGRDTLYGDAGDDRLSGGMGNDRLFGGAGADTLGGGDGDDHMFGGDGNDHLDGSSGRDVLDGGNGADLLIGGAGDDVLRGGAGNDRLFGGVGNDTLIGGPGNDNLTGGLGADVFIFSKPTGSTRSHVTIHDFQRGVDVLDLSAVARSIVWMGTANFSGDGRAELRIQELGDMTRLLIDINGDGRFDMVIDLQGSSFSPFDLLY